MFIKKFIKPWFFDKSCPDRIKPSRMVITTFILLTITGTILKFISPIAFSDMFMAILWGNLSLFVGADTFRSNAKDKYVPPGSGHSNNNSSPML